MEVNVLLFDGFEILDAVGPIEVLGSMKEFSLTYVSLPGGSIKSWQGLAVDTVPITSVLPASVLLLPGARDIEACLADPAFGSALRSAAEAAEYCLTVCTGSALLGATGLLDGRKATTNKMAFDMVKSLNPAVNWQSRARWTHDGKYFTASGISAGQDMVLGFVAELFGQDRARQEARDIEYIWNEDPDDDPFGK